MNPDHTRSRPPVYNQIDLSKSPYQAAGHGARGQEPDLTTVMRQLLQGQQRQNQLLEQLLGHICAHQRHKANELGQWKQDNPRLARKCRRAAEALGKLQTEFLDSLTREITENYDNLVEGDFLLNEFIDRFGPRMVHLNGLLQLLSQLSATANPASQPSSPQE
jgi:hypothetical protein